MADQYIKLEGPIDDATIEQLRQAHHQARLHGPLEAALANPTLATCLRNIVAANQANPKRWYDLSTDGETVFITNIHRRSAGIDIKRRASGDTE